MATQPSPPTSAATDETRPGLVPLTGWDRAAFALFALAALAIATGGFYLSFDAVSASMRPAFGAKAPLVPIIIDSSVLVFSGIDVALARLGMGHPLVRLVPLAGTGATVWLNVAAGGGLSATIAHACMPSVYVAFAEVCRHVVRRRTGLARGTAREGIPVARWLVDPVRSLLLWRRMVLWDIRTYDTALQREFARVQTVAALRDRYGLAWRWRTSGSDRLQIRLGLYPVALPDGVSPTAAAGDPGVAARPRESAAPVPSAMTIVPAQTRTSPPAGTAGPSPIRVRGSAADTATTRAADAPATAYTADPTETALAVYLAFQRDHRVLPSKVLSELAGCSHWNASRLLTTFEQEHGPIDAEPRPDDIQFATELAEAIADGRLAPQSAVAAAA